MQTIESYSSIPVNVAEELIRIIRMLARSGKKFFRQYLTQSIYQANYKRLYSLEKTSKLMDRIKEAMNDPAKIHTVGPIAKRMIAQALTESDSALGDACIFFLEKIIANPIVASSKEAIEFVKVIKPPLKEFQKLYEVQNKKIFEELLLATGKEDLKRLIQPVELDKHGKKIQVSQEAKLLLERIKVAQKARDIAKCRKLLATYLIKYGDKNLEDRKIVDSIIEAFDKSHPNFKKELNDFIAIQLHYQIIQGIVEKNLKKSITAISKYAHIFRGDPNIKFYHEIDEFEKKLYEIIEKKNLWRELKE
ncbi:MAG: hypothetical protein KatS3mg129_2223 [Leptospiraceae bacterium]|nr:MAG: hypothetical protein KatS3mg129_2223 [Leptospiraceae bacterium]